jgi:hypothetical protein
VAAADARSDTTDRCVAVGDGDLVHVGGLAGARKPVRSAVPGLDRYPGVRNEATVQADIRQLLLTGKSD